MKRMDDETHVAPWVRRLNQKTQRDIDEAEQRHQERVKRRTEPLPDYDSVFPPDE